MSETNVAALKEALSAQQQLLQKIYNDLDVERESSATAASEALSMILRLQGEKAAVAMEAEQYKRLAEEKICHAEESMAIFEDLMFQKEMEIASLDYQVQSYRYKVVSMGGLDPGTGELKYPENLLQRTEYLNEEFMSSESIPTRNQVPFSLKHLKRNDGEIERIFESPNHECSTSEEVKDRNPEKHSDHFSDGDINSYWEQIRKLDERVKGLTGGSYQLILSQSESTPTESDRVKRVKESGENENLNDSPCCSSNIHDVFEVPQAEDNVKNDTNGEDSNENIHESIDENGDNSTRKLKKMASVPSQGFTEEMDRLKKMLHPNQRENNLRRFSDGAASSGDSHNLCIVRPATGILESRARPRKFARKREIIELESNNSHGILTSNQREELKKLNEIQAQLKKLNEIQAQLNSIQCDIRSLTSKKSTPEDDYMMHSLQEAMLYFWL